MTALLLLLVALVVVAVVAVILKVYLHYTFQDLVVLAFLVFPVVTLVRYDVQFAFMLLGRPYMGYFLFLSIWLVVFLVVRLVSGQGTNLRISALGACLAALFAFGMLSGVVNEGSLLGIGAPLQASLQWVWPFIVIWVLFKSIPNTLVTHERTIISYVIAQGYIAAPLTIFSAIFAEQLGSLLGWEFAPVSKEAGFMRGSTSVGGPVVAGFLLAVAYALCLSQILRRRYTKFYFVGAILCVIAIMFTLSRSALLMLVFVNILMFRGILFRYLGRIIITFLALSILFVSFLFFMPGRYHFGRILSATGHSIVIRSSSAWAAVDAGLEAPVWGKGPGLFYTAVRFPYMEEAVEITVVSGRYSAAEPHNAYLMFFVENGLIGMGLIIAIYVLFIRRMSKGRRLCSVLPAEETVSNTYWAIMLVMAVYALTASTLWLYMRPGTAIWPIIFMGFHHVACMEEETQRVNLYEDSQAYPGAGQGPVSLVGAD